MFELPDDVRRFAAQVREFARARVAPGAAQRDRTRQWFPEIWAELGARGWLGAIYPKDLGGAGLSFLNYIVMIEELAAVEAALALDVGAHTSLCTGHIWVAGTDEQKRKWIPPLASGKATGSWALTEPEAGSDAGGVRCRAEPDGDGFRISGRKCFITLGAKATIQIVNASTDPARGKEGLTAFIFERPLAGFSAEPELPTVGMCASDTAKLSLDGVRVPAAARLGELHGAFGDIMKVLAGGRIGVAACALGIARASLEAATAYAAARKQFGRPIGEFESVGNMLADTAADVEAAGLLVYRAADRRDRGVGGAKSSSIAKMFASRAAVRAADAAVQIHGGHGYTSEYPVERFWRDAKLTEIGEGTTQIQQIVIARALLKEQAGG